MERGEQILKELSEQADRLSEAQNLLSSNNGQEGQEAKEAKQLMAKSSYAIATALKELMKL